ncbi:transcriptional adapter 2B isoform X2 [Athalia rosae]|uniref:transcriptional adapter 2B isoform X2 n=1 Tax=Athalia rosae TaxID=37344 RepID=UPI0006262864|nr:transcriptional adapter 2B isoform X2 [Athalia rosae]XP_012268706.1 transcriptional adapter 2B isoform X2 [Athalia rosae]XP_012268707.1 transcriptional adapter 2B isoform X2 [Athalia rosae]
MADLYAKYNCTYCQEDIAGLRVKCVECADFDLCLQCFSAGAEIGSHKNDHPYQFMDSGTISIFSGRGNWTAREQLRLLDAIEQFGFGNWEDISKHIETRTPDEAKEEYIARYLEGNIGKHTWPSTESYKPNLTDQTSSDHGPLSPDLTSRLPPLDVTPEEAAQLGYMPQRDDFERDYNHEAESLVSSLFLNPAEDDDLDIALKLAQVDMYTNNLRERARRKRVVRDYQLVSSFFAATRKDRAVKKKYSKEDREFRERTRMFAQFYTAQEYEQFLTNLERERELRLRLTELGRYRENGITRHEECAHFEQVMAQTQGQAETVEHWTEKKSGSSGPSTPTHRQFLKKREEEKNCCSIDPKCTSKADSASNSYIINRTSPSRTTIPVNQLVVQDSNANALHPLIAISKTTLEKGSNSTVASIKVSSMGFTDPKKKDIEMEAAAQLLTKQEKTLCLQLDMKPTQYLTQKTLLLQEYLNGNRRSGIAPQSEPESKILHYLVSNGWIAAN